MRNCRCMSFEVEGRAPDGAAAALPSEVGIADDPDDEFTAAGDGSVADGHVIIRTRAPQQPTFTATANPLAASASAEPEPEPEPLPQQQPYAFPAEGTALPPGWTVEVDDRGAEYFWHAASGESAWECPAASAAAPADQTMGRDAPLCRYASL